MSGILGTLLGSLSGGQPQQQPNEVVNLLREMLFRNGGVQGLISRFNNAGYEEHARSWVRGDPLPMTGKQVSDVFTPDEINRWSTKLVVDPDKMRTVLAEAVPHLVDHLTPNGQTPSAH